VTANRYESFRTPEYFRKPGSNNDIQLCECTKIHWIVHFLNRQILWYVNYIYKSYFLKIDTESALHACSLQVMS
jgi:hypothetical protein